ncbi:MAG: thiamine biosynthesis protein ApbE [Deltaproteobacteria bacterium SG8_13]|nr:MAG: thiamine biosynthesis protein ApbE [Deltaproteobacteria bacterium SG8_13]
MTEQQEKFYRNRVRADRATTFRVVVKETDLWVHADRDYSAAVRDTVLQQRRYIEDAIRLYPDFAKSLVPWRTSTPQPGIVADMIRAGECAGVGPMASVAGAIAEQVGKSLLQLSPLVVVENGGDVFLSTANPVVTGIYAGRSPLSLKVGIRVGGENRAIGVCTSSGTVGHSLSLGRADAVTVVACGCALADAAATATANRIRARADIEDAIAFARAIESVEGVVVIVGERIGAWGNLEIVPLVPAEGAGQVGND